MRKTASMWPLPCRLAWSLISPPLALFCLLRASMAGELSAHAAIIIHPVASARDDGRGDAVVVWAPTGGLACRRMRSGRRRHLLLLASMYAHVDDRPTSARINLQNEIAAACLACYIAGGTFLDFILQASFFPKDPVKYAL
jgi:hypothetical protein